MTKSGSRKNGWPWD